MPGGRRFRQKECSKCKGPGAETRRGVRGSERRTLESGDRWWTPGRMNHTALWEQFIFFKP